MAERATGGDRPHTPMKDKRIREYMAEMERTAQKCADSNTSNMTVYKNFENDGGNKGAIKIVRQLRKMEQSKAHTFWQDLKGYVDLLCPEIARDLFEGPKTVNGKEVQTLDPTVQGRAAFQDGQSLAENPFAPRSKDGAAWTDGWRLAKAAADLPGHPTDASEDPETPDGDPELPLPDANSGGSAQPVAAAARAPLEVVH